MSGQEWLASFLSAVTGPWPTGIATVLLVFTGGMVIPGHSDYAGAWILHTIAAFSLLVVSVNFLHVLGLLP